MTQLINEEEYMGVKCNRFKLMILVAQRAKDLNAGAKKLVSYSAKDKYPVIALREAKEHKLDLESLEFAAIKNYYPCSLYKSNDKRDNLIQEIEQAFGQDSNRSTIVHDSTRGLEKGGCISKEEIVEMAEVRGDLDCVDYGDENTLVGDDILADGDILSDVSDGDILSDVSDGDILSDKNTLADDE